MNTSTTTLDTLASDAESEEVKSLTDKLAAVELQLQDATNSYETLKEAHGAMNVELNVAQQQLCEALKLLDEKCRSLEEIEVQKIRENEEANNTEDKSSDEKIQPSN